MTALRYTLRAVAHAGTWTELRAAWAGMESELGGGPAPESTR